MEKASQCGSTCKRMSEVYVLAASGVFFLLALIVTVAGGVLVGATSELSELALTSPATMALIAGVIGMIFAVCGIVGAWKDNFCLLMIYTFGCIIMTISVFAVGVALLAYTDFFSSISGGEGQVVEFEFKIEEQILAYELAVYNDCCSEPFSLEAPQDCVTKENVFPCIVDPEDYQLFVDFIGEGTCTFWGTTSGDDVAIVADPELGGCGSGNQDKFVADMAQYFEDNLQSFGAVTLVMSVLMFLLTISACVMLWSKQDQKAKQDDADYE